MYLCALLKSIESASLGLVAAQPYQACFRFL